jgi:FixJ family two-component response regulator
MVDEKPVIFVIDDDPSVCTALARLLTFEGYSVETYSTAEAFLERQHFDGVACIVLDVRMPGLSGMDLQENLIGSDYNNIPIIFLTGHGELDTGIKAMKKGAVDFLTKPWDNDQLLGTVHRAVEKVRKARAGLEEIQEIRQRIALLTPREREILRYVITGMLNKQIGRELEIAESTIKKHRGHIMEKLAAQSVADLIYLADKAGIKPFKQ